MIKIDNVTKTFKRRSHAFHALGPVSLSITRGEFVTILGTSGCGKSTLLHIIGGFELASTGQVLANDQPVTRPSRKLGMVFQEATLFPWKTALQNIAWPMEQMGTARSVALEEAASWLDKVGLHRFGAAWPNELSGGMRQRAALARTLAMNPDVLLMDEPFGALDAQTREEMQEELIHMWQSSGLTVIFVTHDITEAIFLGDRVIVMGKKPGVIIDECPIELPRSRSAKIKADPRLQVYHAHLWDLIRGSAIT